MPCVSKSFTFSSILTTQSFNYKAQITSQYGFSVIIPSTLNTAVIFNYDVKVNGTTVKSGVATITVTTPVFASMIGQVDSGSTITVLISVIFPIIEFGATIEIGWLDTNESCIYVSSLNIPILSSIKNPICVNFSSGYIALYPPLLPPYSTFQIPCLISVPLRKIPLSGAFQPGYNRIIINASGPFAQPALQELQNALPIGATIGNVTIVNETISGNQLIIEVNVNEAQTQAYVIIAIAIAIFIVLLAIAITTVIIEAGKTAGTIISIGLGIGIVLVGAGLGIAIAMNKAGKLKAGPFEAERG